MNTSIDKQRWLTEIKDHTFQQTNIRKEIYGGMYTFIRGEMGTIDQLINASEDMKLPLWYVLLTNTIFENSDPSECNQIAENFFNSWNPKKSPNIVVKEFIKEFANGNLLDVLEENMSQAAYNVIECVGKGNSKTSCIEAYAEYRAVSRRSLETPKNKHLAAHLCIIMLYRLNMLVIHDNYAEKVVVWSDMESLVRNFRLLSRYMKIDKNALCNELVTATS